MVSVRARVASDTKTVRKDRRPVAAAAAPSFNPLTGWTTDPVHAVWASDPLWTPPADGGAVSSWRNGGSVGGDLVQATGSWQPTYDASLAAYNNQPVVTFDGADDVLVANTADLTQPFWLVLVGHTSAVTTQGFVGVGVVSTNRRFGTNATAGGKWALALGGEIKGGGLDSNPHLLFAQANGASSLITVDGASVATGDAGTTGITHLSLGAGNANGLTFGGYLTGGIALALVFNTDPTAQAEWASFKAWVTSTYGITVA